MHLDSIKSDEALERIRNGHHIRIDVFDRRLGILGACPSKFYRFCDRINNECREMPVRYSTGIDGDAV